MSLCFALLALVLAQAGVAGPSPRPGYTQSYSVFIKGELAGTEQVDESTDKEDRLVSKSSHELIVTDGLETSRLAFETSLLLARGSLAPVRYSSRYTSGPSKDSFEVTVKNGQATRVLNRGGRSSEAMTPVPADFVLLDFNVYHHYDYLVRHYDMKKRGRQTFNNFIPLIGALLPVAVTFLQDSPLEFGGGTIPVRSFKIEFVGVRTGVFSVDKNGRLVRLLVKDQDLEVLRSDLVPQSVPAPKPEKPPELGPSGR